MAVTTQELATRISALRAEVEDLRKTLEILESDLACYMAQMRRRDLE